jgi:hypothetical protein
LIVIFIRSDEFSRLDHPLIAPDAGGVEMDERLQVTAEVE